MLHEITPNLIATCGNPMAGDDAMGSIVAARLKSAACPHIEIIDLSLDPTRLIDHLAGRRMLIIVDAISWPGHAAGELVDVDWHDPHRPAFQSQTVAGTHLLGIADQLVLAEKLNLLPAKVRLVGLNMETHRVGQSLSACVRAGIERVVERVMAHCRANPGQPADRKGEATCC